MKKKFKYKLKHGFITQKVGDKVTVFSGSDSILYTLNETAAYIFNGLKLGWEEKKLTARLVQRYGISAEQAAKDVADLVKELTKNSIIEPLSRF